MIIVKEVIGGFVLIVVSNQFAKIVLPHTKQVP